MVYLSMMKRSKIVFALSISSLLFTSCYSPKLLVDDDVYVLKSNELPIGESLNDETSYSTFKNRQNSDMVSSNYYNNIDDLNYYPLCRNSSNFFIGCGCSFYAYSHFYGYRSYNQFGNSSMFYNPYSPFGYDPFYNSMGYYNPYGYNPYGYDPYGFYGSGYGNYGNTSYNQGNVTTNYNHHSGPRGSMSGIGNPSGRPQTNTLKSTYASTSTNKPYQPQTSNNSKINPSVVVGQSNYTKQTYSPTAGRNSTTKAINYTSSSNRAVRSSNNGLSTNNNSSRSTVPSQRGSNGGNESNGGRLNPGSISTGGSNGGSSGGGRAGSGSSSGTGRRN